MTEPTSPSAELERQVDALESDLHALAGALRVRDAESLEAQAARLQRGLAGALRCCASVDASTIPPAVRRRLADASAQLVRQRETLARSTASLDRAVELLLPRDSAAGLYGRSGRTTPASRRSLAA